MVFALASLAGPLLRLATWPPSRFSDATSAEAEDFVSEVVFYLWPTQPIAAYESAWGTPAALFVAVGGNLALFGFIGLVIGAVATRRRALAVSYSVVCILLVLFALWAAGYRLEHVSAMPLLSAMVFYATPFWAVAARFAGRRPITGA
jgi:hypothetical protein